MEKKRILIYLSLQFQHAGKDGPVLVGLQGPELFWWDLVHPS